MPYRLKFNEPLGKGWRRIVREQIEQAMGRLSSGQDEDGAIHETRKSMKRVRALLKVLRPGLSASDYKRENRRYRDIARVLAGVRDRAVLKATAETLSKETSGEVRAAADAFLLRMSLEKEGGDPDQNAVLTRDTERAKAAHVREALAALEAAAKSLEKLHFKENSFAVVLRGIERSYRVARNDMRQALDSGVDEDFHAWRKSVQAHWRHMLLIDRAWPDLFAARAQLAKEISDLLGFDHDLFVLIGSATRLGEQGAEVGGDAMVRAARARQHEIRKELEVKGAALFAEPTARFVASVKAYWRAAKRVRKLEKAKKRAKEKAAPSSAASGKKVARASGGARKGGNDGQAGGNSAAPATRGARAEAWGDEAGAAEPERRNIPAKTSVAPGRVQGSDRGGPKGSTPSGKV